MSRERLQIIGFYVLAALIIARVVIAPLQHSLRDKKTLLKEYQDTYKMRMLSFEKYKAQEKEKSKETGVEEGFAKSLYDRNVPYSSLQSDLVEKITALAEKQKLTLLSFEFAEPTSLKAVSEAPVTVRVGGEQKGVIALLGELEKDSRKLVVRRFDNTKSGAYGSVTLLTISAFRLEK
ncbi:MAG: hypothetical protein HQL08_06615 [Nitrospirae bacterium]|nr:hypothetical protein [Nitrospirota bacterium]